MHEHLQLTFPPLSSLLLCLKYPSLSISWAWPSFACMLRLQVQVLTPCFFSGTGTFIFLLLIAGYAGLSSLQLDYYINDKVLHFLTFLALSLAFYWILDTNRRRTLNLTLILCTGVLGVGSEFVQAVLPNGREFDVFDILANIVGSLCGVALCSWYHKRMLERKRRRRGYATEPGGDGEEHGSAEDVDIELGERDGHERQESGLTRAPTNGQVQKSLEQRVDEWDENNPDAWDEDDEAEEADITSGANRCNS